MIGRSVRRAVRRVCDRSNFSFRHLIFACIYAGWAASSSHQVLGVSRANRHFTHQDASANPRAIECPQQLAPRVVSVSMALPSPQCHQRPAFPAGRPSLSLRLSPFPSLSPLRRCPPPSPPPLPGPPPPSHGRRLDDLLISKSSLSYAHLQHGSYAYKLLRVLRIADFPTLPLIPPSFSRQYPNLCSPRTRNTYQNNTVSIRNTSSTRNSR